MSTVQTMVQSDRSSRSAARPRTTLAAFVLGLPFAAGILFLIHYGPLRDTVARRYVRHPVECVEVLLFSCAIGGLGAKLWAARRERAVCRQDIVPRWDGLVVPVKEAAELQAGVERLPRRLRGTYLVRRVGAVLEFLVSRGSANELDDHLRTLADNDAMALEGSYAMIRFITWAIPILGFLGTVLGITGAISGVTPEVLEKSLSTVTDGLALAFDATALALGLTMFTMFCNFLIDRLEQGVLEQVDAYAERELAHRFERSSAPGAIAYEQADALLDVTEKLVQRQAEVWARSLEEITRRQATAEQQQQQRLTHGIEAALEKTQETHGRRLAGLEKQAVEQSSALLERMTMLATAVREQQTALTALAQALAGLQEGSKQLVRLEEGLQRNLQVVAGTGTFEEALHSLTAAIHLMTAKTGGAATRLFPGKDVPGRGAA